MSRRSAREVVLHLIFSHDFLNNDADELLENRYLRFRKIGIYEENGSIQR